MTQIKQTKLNKQKQKKKIEKRSRPVNATKYFTKEKTTATTLKKNDLVNQQTIAKRNNRKSTKIVHAIQIH